jgi:hypothetical protein
MAALSSGGIANGKIWCGGDLEQKNTSSIGAGGQGLPDPSLVGSGARAPVDA